MKYGLVLSVLLLILFSSLIGGQYNYASSLTGTGISSNTPRICVLSNCNYYGTTSVCGRLGSSNLCKRFRNNCLMRYETCVNRITYTAVSMSFCSNIAVGSRRQCSGSSSSSSSIFGTGSTYNSNVRPIVIRTRRG
ncbi:uncharacterized protein LOC116805911 [Drosophila grimshawi]|uniref:uncharacterized protein LOC116805911 n=1 Tax=Drosophila grimshawi TaxID=7222 RepID=UPI000C8705D7|nr:uncharacterized protein LOC116805911 [Drosophila grimshawi]